jgi:hypothetical protein
MNVPRSVILDLLPLYVAGEVSAETQALIEDYLQTDPELAKAAEASRASELPGEIPVPLSKENEIETYEQAKRQLLQRTIILAVVLAFAVLACGALTTLAILMLSHS